MSRIEGAHGDEPGAKHLGHRIDRGACGSRWLLRFSDELADHAYRYRQRSMQRDYRQRDVAAEHAAILEAALADDGDRAVRLLTAHFRRTADALPFVEPIRGSKRMETPR